MPTTTVNLMTLGALALTRAALGAGVGLLVADRLDPRPRRVLAAALLTVGLASTAPLVVSILKGAAPTPSGQRQASGASCGDSVSPST
jgi:hypothetical protein